MTIIHGMNSLDDATNELRHATRELRKHTLRSWLDTDPELRDGFIALDPELGRLKLHVDKLERLAIGFADRAPRGAPPGRVTR
jgi:hypothetical protein